MSLRWKLVDPYGVLDDFTFPINPKAMDPTELATEVVAQTRGVRLALTGVPVVWAFDTQQPAGAEEWTFQGVLYTLDQHDALETWLDNGRPILLSDHFGRTFVILLKSIDAVRVGAHFNHEKHKYTAHALMLARLV